jgi:DNA repair exonuclease SbcCD ATPase subunit
VGLSKIKRLIIRNALGIEEKAINPGNVNIISGGNAKGKTSILEVIEKALYNTDRRDQFVRIGAEKAYIELETDDGLKVERIVNEDGKSDVKVIKDGIPIRAPQTYLNQLFGVSKERKDVFAFNPVDFMNKPPKEQSKILLSLMPITVTQKDMMAWFGKIPPINTNMHGLLVLKELEKYWYDARHEANGAVRATEAEVEALQKQLPDNYEVEKWEKFSTMALSDEIRKGEQINNYRKQAQELIDGHEAKKQAINNKYDLRVKEQEELRDFKVERAKKEIEGKKQGIRDNITYLNSKIKNHEDKIQELLQLIEAEKRSILDIQGQIKLKENDLEHFDNSILTTKTESLTNEMNIAIQAIEDNRQKEISEAEERIKVADQFLVDNPEVDIAPLEEKYREAESMKGYVEMAHNLQNVINRLQDETETAECYDSFVKFCRNKPSELLKTVELPVEGLGINDDGIVTIDGLPLKNLNTAKQVTVCLDIARAYAKDNPMKLVCVDKIEHLDATAREEFFRQIEADGEYQYFVTWVTDGEMQIDTRGQI